jgi:uncharacterized protein YabE (DUF348 family)
MYHFWERHRFVLTLGISIMVFLVSSALLIILNQSNVEPNDTRLISLYVDGETHEVPTRAKTVGEFIGKSTVTLGEGDIVEPDLDQQITYDSYRVRVLRARPYTVVDGATTIKTITAHNEPRLIAEKAGLTVRPADAVEFRQLEAADLVDTVGRVVDVQRSKRVQFVLYGTAQEVFTRTTNVGAMLGELGVERAADDEVVPALDTAVTEGMQVFINRKGTQVIVAEEVIAPAVEYIDDPSLTRGSIATRDPGAPGKRIVTYELTIQNGKEIARKEIQVVVVQQPVKKVVVRGTAAISTTLEEWLYKLRMCESGGNYQISTGNGFYGAYQFLASTWNRVAPKAGRPDLVGILPNQASPADQDFMIVANTNMTSGLVTQNPGCYQKTGISNYPPAR